MQSKNIILFLVYFLISTLLTCWFVILCPLYISKQQMLLSTGIAGGKWMIQILLALVFLKDKSYLFLKNIGFVCLTGSCILIPYIFSARLGISNSGEFFFASLITSVITMILLYYRAVKITGISLGWWFTWLGCLAIAVSLQLTVVFHYVKL